MYVLVLTGAEVHFLTVASMGLCFGFLLETVDNSGMFYLSLSSAHRFKAFAALHPTSPARRLGVHRKVGKEMWQLPTSDHRHSECLVFVFPSHMQRSSALLSLTQPACQWEVVNAFFVLLCLHEQFLLSLLNFISTHETSHFSYSLPHSTSGSVREWLGGAELLNGVKAHPKLNYNKRLKIKD